MGNSHCVPQAPRRLRASFSRKPSLKGNREDSARKLASLFGTEASPDGDAATDKIFHYIPGTDITVLENQPENLEQPFLSVFKKGRRRTPVRNLGKVVHYAKVQLRFQHTQDISDCYLELFPSHLYFQAHGSEGLTLQGLLPLTELSICPLEGSREYAFQITGMWMGLLPQTWGLCETLGKGTFLQAQPLQPTQLLHPSGPLPAPLLVLCHSEAELNRWLYHLEKQMALVGGLRRCHSAPPQGSTGDELLWSLQRRLTQLQRASGQESVGSAICASRVKLQHLPSQEQWDRLLVLYPGSLAIFSEEPDGLGFKGELPLSAIHINLEEKEKQIRSFLIEGRLINTIRVVCASYEDYSHWLLCLRTVCHKDGHPLLPGPSLMAGPPSSPGLQGPTQDLANSDCANIGQRRTELRRSSSSRSPRSRGEVRSRATPQPLRLDLTKVKGPDLENNPEAPDHSLDIPHSPLYADPYTPPATSHRKITDVQGLDEFLSAMRTSPGPEPSSLFSSVPVSDSSSRLSSTPGLLDPYLLSNKRVPQSRASQRQRGSVKGQGSRPPDSPQLVINSPHLVTSAREDSPSPLQLPPESPCSGRRLHLPPTRSGHNLGGLRQSGGSSSGFDGP
ncbi:pleckstrin homology domain-containing family N member 1 isoform X3 [Perognathus longimembris pacificus]|uniref:pleckstrin homology domain-containing family N member 1 isoform X3 n=1 Tax=Perognathus longimembris pacificus TaxID=214514 RepID=UPI002019061C|nr:pleckstrin homology domain-containing family N member 1 isoform X3 [Perognathus longimembris pacificus]